MKIQDLLEASSNKQEQEQEAHAKVKDLMSKVADGLEDLLDADFDDSTSGRYVTYTAEEFPKLKITGSVIEIRRFVNQGKILPVAEGSFVLDVPSKSPGLFEKLKKKITQIFKDEGIHLGWSNGSPWYFDDHNRYTAKYDLMKFPEEDEPKREAPASSHRYDPRAEFNSRPGEMARQRRVAQSAYSDSFGGDSSNYRR